MAWTSPIQPISGTTITVAWATTTIVDNLNWLRVMTGDASPPGVGYIARAISSTATAWYDLDTALLSKVPRDNPGPSAASFDAALSGKSGFADVGNTHPDGPSAGGDWFLLQNRHSNTGVNYRMQFAANINDQNQLYYRQVINNVGGTWRKLWHAGNGGAGSGLDADLLDGQSSAFYAPATHQVPTGLIAAFANAASIASGWTRFTNLDGRIPVGAGTTFSQTFVEGASAGSSWAHLHGTTSSNVQSGGGASVAASGNTSDATWLPPSFAVVFGQKT